MSYSKTRACSGLKDLTVINDGDGQKLANAAADSWNKLNPKKRQTGEGEGDGDEPYLNFQYRVEKDGTLSLLTSVYNF